jgi:hypothetical protein
MARVRVQQTPEQPVRTITVPQAASDADLAQPVVASLPVHQPAPVYPDSAQPAEQSYYPVQQADASVMAIPTQGIFITRKTVMWAVALILVMLALAVAYANRERPAGPSGTLGTSQAPTEAEGYYQEISKYIEVPANETPTVLNVSDADAVKKDNATLSDIKNGDKLLFFTKSRKLVVYRPSSKKVVAAVSLAAPAATTPPSVR